MLRVPSGAYKVIPYQWTVGNKMHDHVIARQMIEQGWCRRQLLRLDQMRLSAQYYISRLERPHQKTKSHENCGLYDCQYEEINKAEYVTRHANEDCDCEHVEFSREAPMQIVDKGCLPLVKVDVSLENPHITFTATPRFSPWSTTP